MAATLPRRTWRRVRLGSRHARRALSRQRLGLAIAAGVAVVTIGAAAGGGPDGSPGSVRPTWPAVGVHGHPFPGAPSMPGPGMPMHPGPPDRN